MRVSRRRRLQYRAALAWAVVAATVCAAPLTVSSTATAAPGSAAAALTPHSRVLPGTACRVFPASSIFHKDISKAPVSKHSKVWLAHMHTAGTKLHPDFGPSYGAQPVPYGIPVTTVKATHAKVKVHFTYASESDRITYPLGSDTKIEGGKGATGDRHAIVVNAKTCRLYETYDTHHTSHGWTAGSGASWNLNSNALRPAGWTSADAAGLPILVGLLRYDEVKAGSIDHPIRFTTDITSDRYVWPARHEAGSTKSGNYPPMGAWFRLKASYSTKGYSKQARVILTAMKHHGLILADNGSPWYFQGTSDSRWPDGLIAQLKRIPASAFQAIDVSKLKVSKNSAKAR